VAAVEIMNFTGELARAEAFIRAKCALIGTEGLSIHIKHTRAKRRDVTGYYRFADRRIVIAVKRRLRYPRTAAYGVGSITPLRKPLKGRPYKLVWHEDRFENPDDLLAFVAGHEIWHFLCHSGQRKGDHETKANCNGFLGLQEFRRWAGAGARVEPIPPLPPRPDRPAPSTALPPRLEPARHVAAAPPPRVTPSSAIAAFARRAAERLQAWSQGELFSDGAGAVAQAPRPRPSEPRRSRRPRTR
jgi:hypothetical protein